MGKSNIVWINTIKVVCMLLVYINHSEIFCNCYCEAFGWFYRPVFVNAFFFVSGYLLLKKQWNIELSSLNTREWYSATGGGEKSLLLSIIYKLYLPTALIWSLSYTSKTLTLGNFELTRFTEVTLGGDAAWFTMALAVAELFLFIMLLCRPNRKYMYLIYAIALWSMSEFIRSNDYMLFDNPNIPWNYRSGMDAVIFMVFGGYYSQITEKLKVIKSKSLIPYSLCIVVAYLLCCFSFHDGVMTALDWQGLNLRGFLISIIGILALIEVVSFVPSYRFIDYLGRHTIGLYFFSAFIPKAVAPIVIRFLPSIHNYSITILVTTISFALAFVIVWFFDMYMPFIFDLRLLKNKKL